MSQARTKEERTADIRTIFKKVSDHINIDTGKTISDHICTICK